MIQWMMYMHFFLVMLCPLSKKDWQELQEHRISVIPFLGWYHEIHWVTQVWMQILPFIMSYQVGLHHNSVCQCLSISIYIHVFHVEHWACITHLYVFPEAPGSAARLPRGEGIYFAAKSGRMCAKTIVKNSKQGVRMIDEDGKWLAAVFPSANQLIGSPDFCGNCGQPGSQAARCLDSSLIEG